jgi:hypothetical protein
MAAGEADLESSIPAPPQKFSASAAFPAANFGHPELG